VPLLLTADGDCEGLVVGDCVGDKVGLGEGDGDALGVGVWVGVGVGVGVGAVARLAVIVPGPLIVAVVEPANGFPTVMFPVSLDHEENV
jgi:hypothetical protein